MNMQPGRPNNHQSVAGQAQTGRVCPYCRFPLKEGVEIVVCGVCGASHHADCWHDNGGCAVIACAGGPAATAGERIGEAGMAPTTAYPPAPAQTGAQSTSPPSPPMWQQQQPSSDRRGPSLAVAVIVLAVAVGGAAAAIVLSRQSNSPVRLAKAATPQTVTAPAPAQTTTPGTGPEAQSTNPNATTTPSSEEALPAVPSQQMQSEIQHMLLEWHEDVVHSNYHVAWELLSHRKQAQDDHEYGYAKWVENQSTLNPYLNPSGLQVSIEHTEPSSGVTQVDVTGMTWDKPGASCAEWSGITWAKYEEGAWKYDPGYSTTPQREREWKPRFSELLGGRC